MNPVIYAVVNPTATDPKDRIMPVSGTDNGDGTCSVDTTGGAGGGGDATAANQVLQLAQETATKIAVVDTSYAIGGFDDSAAPTDTSDTGLISLFKRHLQRWTTFFTLLPASIGQKAMAGSLAVTVASDQSRVKVEPLGQPSTAKKITTSGTSAVVTLAAGTTRVSIYATKAAYFSLGTGSLVATTSDFFIGDGERLDFNVTAGGKLAAIQDSTAGVVYITELV